jgi:hypothetical protein
LIAAAGRLRGAAAHYPPGISTMILTLLIVSVSLSLCGEKNRPENTPKPTPRLEMIAMNGPFSNALLSNRKLVLMVGCVHAQLTEIVQKMHENGS